MHIHLWATSSGRSTTSAPLTTSAPTTSARPAPTRAPPQLHLVGPFTLLRCLEPQLAAGRARVVFSVSMTHRLATLPSPRDFVGAWHKGTGPRCVGLLSLPWVVQTLSLLGRQAAFCLVRLPLVFGEANTDRA